MTMHGLVLLALVGAAFAAVPRNEPRIVGGTATAIEDYPYMSGMLSSTLGLIWRQACAGTLITSRTIVSAAHCYDGDRPSNWRARLGSSFRSSGGTVYDVAELIIHPQYGGSSTYVNDVAIIRLNSRAELSESVQPIRIAGSNYILPDSTDVIAIGWGARFYGGSPVDQLRRVTVNTVNHGTCTERYAFLKSLPGFRSMPDVTDAMICAGVLDDGGKGACQGDEGGPLVFDRNILIGIDSWRFRCGHRTYPAVYASVSHLSDWIAANGSG